MWQELQDISYIDAVILVPILIGLIRGLTRGLISEIVGIVAVLLGIVGARLWAGSFTIWLTQNFTWPEPICHALAYALLFLGISLLCNLVGRMLSKLLRILHLGWANKILGAAFGGLKWSLIVLAILYGVDLVDQQFHFIKDDFKKESACYTRGVELSHAILSVTREQLGEQGILP